MNQIEISEQKLKQVTFPKVTVKFDRISSHLTKAFNPQDLKRYLSIYDLAQTEPKLAQKELELFQEKYPKLPEIYSLMSFIYIQQKKLKKSEKLIKQNYLENSNNLFAKINYADQCLRKGKDELVLAIFNNKTCLQKLYPNRECFHYSELLGFLCLMGFYFLKKGNRSLALDYCAYAKMIDSHDQTVLLLEKKIMKRSFLQSIIEAINFRSQDS